MRLKLASALVALAGLAAGTPLAAQARDVTKAAASITAKDVSRRIHLIADDSMMGRDTPSPGLETAAAYIAAQFKSFGLRPAGDSGTYLQRFPLVLRQLQVDRSYVEFTELNGQGSILLPYATSVVQHAGEQDGKPISAPILLLGGPPNPDRFPADSVVTGKLLVWVVKWSEVPQFANAIVLKAVAAGAAGIIALSDRDTTVIAALAGQAGRVQVSRDEAAARTGGIPLVVEVPQAAIIARFPQAQGVFDQLNGAGEMTVLPMSGWEATVMASDTVLGTATAPNVVGILEGTDPTLKHEYVVFSAHMDHIGISPGKPDSINNGADDDGSGTVGILELAEAFTRKRAATRRSLIFLTVSGEEKGLWGSAYFTAHPPVPIDQVVANLNMDMIGRNWPDTVETIGMTFSSLGPTLDSVAAAHRDLGMTPVNDLAPQERRLFRSDHYNFARAGVPILYFTSGHHPDYHEPSDSPDKINAEKESRLLQLVFWTGQAVGNAATKPTWNPGALEQVRQAR
ncbi:MAG TPA: M28 family peptidase [Gemmatimonadales bacterium]|nr:M28 family peptidase [Gemmatimonadales bacterium]